MEKKDKLYHYSPDPYYEFVDPKRKLSEKERFSKAEEMVLEMPSSFPLALAYVMSLANVTIEKLAEEAHISTSTVDRYKRKGKEQTYNPDKVVAMCIAMHLPPWLSFELMARAGFNVTGSIRNHTLVRVLLTMYGKTIDEVQKNLITYGSKPLKLSV